MFKEFNQTRQKEKQQPLVLVLLLMKKGIVVTNNHVIQGAEDIVWLALMVLTEYKAKVIGSGPLHGFSRF